MANSLRAKISKLRHDGNITDAEYQKLIAKLDGHDKQIRADAIDEFCNVLCSNGAIADFMKDYITEKGKELKKCQPN